MLHGHVPKLSRADDICRALSFTFMLGSPMDEDGSGADEPPSETGSPTEQEFIRDIQLSELLSRLADHWETIPVRERGGLGLAVTSLLDLAGAKGGYSLDRTVQSLGWRILDARMQSDTDPQDTT